MATPLASFALLLAGASWRAKRTILPGTELAALLAWSTSTWRAFLAGAELATLLARPAPWLVAAAGPLAEGLDKLLLGDCPIAIVVVPGQQPLKTLAALLGHFLSGQLPVAIGVPLLKHLFGELLRPLRVKSTRSFPRVTILTARIPGRPHDHRRYHQQSNHQRAAHR